VELERRGVAAVVLGTDEFHPLGLAEATSRGLPDLPIVTVPHPIGGVAPESVAAKASAIADALDRALAPGGSRGASSAAPAGPARAHAAPDDLDAFQAWVMGKGWGDGLPVIPPTPARVERMLRAAGRGATEIVAVLPLAQGAATVEAVAVNAVMAGALPEHLPLILAAVEAVAEPAFNLQAIQATTHPCTPLVIVNGPAAVRLGVNAAGNALGQGRRANAAIGRALRLTLVNVGGAHPGREDRATLGHPGKYSYCLAENEAASPWESLAVERGFSARDSTVTVCGSDAPHNVNDHGSSTAAGIVTTVAGTAITLGMNNVYLGGEPLVVLGPEHAATVAGGGLGKAAFKRAVWEAARVPLGRFSAENLARFAVIDPEGFKDRAPDTLRPMARDWRDLMVIVAGGAGKHSAVIPTFGATRSVTRRVRE
jgi:hypothetical protein